MPRRGPDPGPDSPALKAALDALEAPRRPAREDDAPPIRAFPMTRAAREALRMMREAGKEPHNSELRW